MYSIPSLSIPPPPALGVSRARRQRSNAVSRARESEAEWDSASAAADTSGSPTTSSLLPPPDELICPLAPDTRRAHADLPRPANADAKVIPSWVPVPVWPADEGELQAVLAQFAFPTTTGRKHRRSGEIVVDSSPTSSVGSPPPAPAGSGKRRSAIGPTRCAWCAHCERGRSGA